MAGLVSDLGKLSAYYGVYAPYIRARMRVLDSEYCASLRIMIVCHLPLLNTVE
jgi:hypothetical protein